MAAQRLDQQKKVAVMLNEAKTSRLRPTIIIMKKVPNND